MQVPVSAIHPKLRQLKGVTHNSEAEERLWLLELQTKWFWQYQGVTYDSEAEPRLWLGTESKIVLAVPGHIGGRHEGVGAHRALGRVVQLWSLLLQGRQLKGKNKMLI